MNIDEVGALLQNDFDTLQALDAREYTLHRKCVEIKKKYPFDEEPNPFFDSIAYPELTQIKDRIWTPKHPDDFLALEPELIRADTKDTKYNWDVLRNMCSSAIWSKSPGRLLRYYVQDKVTQKFLGVISIGSDFISVGGRDSHIGWTTDDKLKKGKLRHTAMGSTIVPCQPFGHNYNGGKLIAMLAASRVVSDDWKERYKETLMGVTTTSLYGGASMYNRCPNWRKCKSTTGQIALEPGEDSYLAAKEWYRNYDIDTYNKIMVGNSKSGIGTHTKSKILSEVYKACGVKPPVNNAPRGVYWNELRTNTKEFLRCETDEVGPEKYDNSVDTLSELWKTKFATKRIANLIKDDRLSSDVLFYSDMITDSWDTIRNRYLG